MSGYQKLGLVTIAGLLALTALGGTVRVTDSGLACPDWPLCNGKLIPTGDYHVWLEWTHRLVASLIGFVILAYVAGAIWKYRDRFWVAVPAAVAVVLLGIQVVLGGLTVTENLDPAIVSAHLVTAMLIVLLIMTSWLATFAPLTRNREPAAPGASNLQPRLAKLSLASAVTVYALIIVGAYVTNSDAGFFCDGDWPLCDGAIWPDGEKAQTQQVHRFLAAVGGVLLLVTWLATWRQRAKATRIYLVATLMLLLLGVQIVLGAATQWTDLSQWSRVVHLAVGAALWGATAATAALSAHAAGWIRVQRSDRSVFAWPPWQASATEGKRLT